MIRRSISCMLAGTLAAIGFDLLLILSIPSDRPTPGALFLAAGFVAAMGTIWLIEEIADGLEPGVLLDDRDVLERAGSRQSADRGSIDGIGPRHISHRLARSKAL
jgi:hypothetical protein